MKWPTKTKKRILSFWLSICLAVSFLPVDACAAGSMDDSSFTDGGDITDADYTQIPENAGKTVYTAGNGKVYYIPGEGKSLDKLVLDNAKLKGVIGFSQNVGSLILEVKGSSQAGDIECPADVTLAGSGSLTALLMATGFSKEGFSGELNAFVGVFPDDNQLQFTVYGNAVLPLGDYGYGIDIGSDENETAVLTVMPGASLTIPEESSLGFFIVGDNADDYMDIQGNIINNGELLLDGQIPDDVAGFIKSLYLSGDGIVNVYHENREQTFYSNSGNELHVYNGSGLDFGSNIYDQGELAKDGYHWDEEEKTLTLCNFMTNRDVFLPGGIPVKVVTQGDAYTGNINIFGDMADVSFSGEGRLRAGWFMYEDGRLTVEADAKVTMADGIGGGVGSELIVKGKLTVGAPDGNPAIVADYVTIGRTGELSVSGMAGIIVLGNENDSLSGAFTIEEGGSLSADCTDCSIMAYTISKEAADKAVQDAFILPDGYMPDGYAVQVMEIGDSSGEGYAATIAPKNAKLQWSAEYFWFVGAGSLTLHRHIWGEWISGGDGTHTHVCSLDGSYTETEQCDFTNYVSDGNAACTTDGTKTAKCNGCGAVHTVDDAGSATGHSYGNWNITVEPTQTATGIAERICTRNCGHKDTAVLPVLTDTSVWTAGKRIEPTVGANGSQEYISEYGIVTVQISAVLDEDTAADVIGSTVTDADGNIYKIIGNADGTDISAEYIAPKKDARGAVTIPDTVTAGSISCKVTAIADNAFKNNGKITKVTIGKNITAIGKKSFYGCKNLKTIIIKTKKLTAKTIGAKAFQGINKKALIKVPKAKFKTYKTILKSRGVGSKAKFKKI